jgi:hypothetical protein
MRFLAASMATSLPAMADPVKQITSVCSLVAALPTLTLPLMTWKSSRSRWGTRVKSFIEEFFEGTGSMGSVFTGFEYDAVTGSDGGGDLG